MTPELRHLHCVIFFLSLAWLGAAPAAANPGGYSLLGDGDFFQRTSAPAGQPSNALFAPPQASIQTGDAEIGHGAVSLNPAAASLFRGRNSGSFFERLPEVGIDVAEIMNVIASAEAGRADYDAVQYGATVKPRKKPTQMTLREIYTWIKATPGQPHAIGRYQFIPATLKRLVEHQSVPLDRHFTVEVQDQLAHQLIEEAGLSQFKTGEMSQVAFMNNLAKIWAGLPNSSGKSHYHNYAGNKATITWDHFKSRMDQIFSS